MAATEAFLGYGTLLKRGDGGSPETFSTFAEVTSISGLNWGNDLVEATHMESPNGYREFIYGLKDGQDFTVEAHFIPSSTGWANVLSDFDNKITRNYQMVMSDDAGSTFTFSALTRSINVSTPVDNKPTASITFKVSGAITQSV